MGKREALSAEALFAFVVTEHQRTREWPTLKTCADHFRATMDAIEEEVSAFTSDTSGLDLIVAWKSGSGIATITHRRDYRVEAWREGLV